MRIAGPPDARPPLRWVALATGALLLLACAGVPPPIETGQLFLWEVARSDGSGGRAHLMGSIHLSDDEIAFDPAVEQALASAGTLVLEVAPDELDPERMAELTEELGTFDDGRTLESVLSPDTWKLLVERLERERLDPAAFSAMKPWLVGITLQLVALTRQGFDPDRGVDLSLARSAEAAGKSVVGLETAEEQFAALDSLPLATQEVMLRGVLEDEGGDPAQGVPLMLEAWRKGDADRLEAEIFGGLREDPSLRPFYDALYFRRNRHMASGIARIVDAGGIAFVAVGAAHVVGEQGVPALLAARGYRVRRLPKTAR